MKTELSDDMIQSDNEMEEEDPHTLRNKKDRQKFLMDEGEKEEMIAALKKKWEVVHKEY